MTEVKFRRAFENVLHMSEYNGNYIPADVTLELLRCYALLDAAVEMAEFYAGGHVDFHGDEELPNSTRATKFLEKVK